MASRNMEVSVRGAEETRLANYQQVKFVVADDAQIRHLVLGPLNEGGFSLDQVPELEHIELVPPDTHFIGAGEIRRKGEEIRALWNSITCKREFGHFRPADDMEAEQVRSEVVEAFQNWLQTALNK